MLSDKTFMSFKEYEFYSEKPPSRWTKVASTLACSRESGHHLRWHDRKRVWDRYRHPAQTSFPLLRIRIQLLRRACLHLLGCEHAAQWGTKRMTCAAASIVLLRWHAVQLPHQPRVANCVSTVHGV